MSLRMFIAARGEARWRTGHKPLALLYSLALHIGLVALAFLPGPVPAPAVYRSVVVELEKDHKLIYYDFRKELPEVSPTNPSAKRTTPGPDALQSKQRIVAFPQEKPGRQLVYIPEPRIQLKEELTAPNLIAVEQPPVPLPDKPKPKPFQAPDAPKPAPPKIAPLPSAPAVAANSAPKDSPLKDLLQQPAGPPPKQFVPPSQKPNAAPAAPVQLPNAPAVATASIERNSSLLPLLDKPVGPPPKQFVPPPAAAKTGTSGPAQLPSAPAVSTTGGAGTSMIAGLINTPAGPPPKPFTPPPVRGRDTGGNGTAPTLPAAPAVAGGTSSAAATVAILGLNPANVPQIPKPEGSRPARIEAGTPTPGATRPELGGGNSGISMPGVSIQGAPANSPATATHTPLDREPAPPPTGLARPQPPQVLPTTPHVSVPQWPSTRRLPAAVERHFQDRVVYLTTIPSAQGGDDWIIWFGEVSGAPAGASGVVHPPVLLKSGALPPFGAHSDHGTGHIRLAGIIGKEGHLQSLTELAGGAADRELVEALESWQFIPARRNGIAIDADAVIEIPVVFGKLSLR